MKLISILLKFVLIAAVIFSYSCNRESAVNYQFSKKMTYDFSEKLLEAPSNFFDKPDEYLEWQTEIILDLVDEFMQRNLPRHPETIERHMAMLMLDAVFHDEQAPKRPAVKDFHHLRTLHALNEMKKTDVNEGAMIWKLYNMATVIRTKTATVGFDITRGKSSGSEDFALPDSLINAVVDQCDILFISHSHQDHADEYVAQEFLNQGKSIVAPPNIWKDLPIYEKITHLDRKPHKIHFLSVGSENAELEVVVYPGHQGSTPNNVTLVTTPEGLSFCHTGDQANNDDFEWIDDVKKYFKVDVLIPNCWTTDPLRMANGLNPELIIPSHENELGHTIDHREAYALNYSRWNVPYPKLIMGWGESYYYNP